MFIENETMIVVISIGRIQNKTLDLSPWLSIKNWILSGGVLTFGFKSHDNKEVVLFEWTGDIYLYESDFKTYRYRYLNTHQQ